MKQHKKSKLLLLIILICGVFTCGQGHAEIDTDHIFVLSPNHDTATYDYYSYSPAESVTDVTYFLVLFGGLQTEIETLSVKLSSAPVFHSYTGSVRYCLFAAGYPNIYCAKMVTVTNSTVASNYIKADFSVNSQYGFALIGAALLQRHDVSPDVKMSLRVSVQ